MVIKMAKLKVYGGLTFVNGKQLRTIIAETSQKKASKKLGITLGDLRNYWSATGNKIEVDMATSKPGFVFKASTSMGSDFKLDE